MEATLEVFAVENLGIFGTSLKIIDWEALFLKIPRPPSKWLCAVKGFSMKVQGSFTVHENNDPFGLLCSAWCVKRRRGISCLWNALVCGRGVCTTLLTKSTGLTSHCWNWNSTATILTNVNLGVPLPRPTPKIQARVFTLEEKGR